MSVDQRKLSGLRTHDGRPDARKNSAADDRMRAGSTILKRHRWQTGDFDSVRCRK